MCHLESFYLEDWIHHWLLLLPAGIWLILKQLVSGGHNYTPSVLD